MTEYIGNDILTMYQYVPEKKLSKMIKNSLL